MTACAGMRALEEKEFHLLKNVIYRESGIHLTEMKNALVQARVMKRLRELKIWNYKEYCCYLSDNYDREIINLINCITTNKTDFFREPKHFEFLKEAALPAFEKAGRKQVSIWSAGCSTGAEPYSIAITVFEYFRDKKIPDIKILATDIDTEVLRKGESGIYTSDEVGSIDQDILQNYFMRGVGQNSGLFKVKDFMKKIIHFDRLNLLNDTYPLRTVFDIIFCRNVIIYFDVESRQSV